MPLVLQLFKVAQAKEKRATKSNLQSKANWVEIKWKVQEQLAMKVDGELGGIQVEVEATTCAN